jgi:anti-anti-sigma factor
VNAPQTTATTAATARPRSSAPRRSAASRAVATIAREGEDLLEVGAPRRSPRPAIVTLSGEYDQTTAFELKVPLDDAARGRSVLWVDMRDVNFLDSSTVHVLAALARRRRAVGDSLVIQSPSGIVQRVLDACGLQDLTEPSRPSTAWVPCPT